jgi:CBS domain-containing protein
MSVIRVSDFMVFNPVTAGRDTPLVKVAQLMRDNSISSIILTEDKKPYGIVTERDLVWRVVASGIDVNSLKASDVCSKPVLTVSEDESIEDAIKMMKEYGVRRLVVLDEEGEVSGILTSDDIVYNIEALTKELALEYIVMSRNIRRQLRE